MTIEEAKKRLKLLMQDDCECEECLKDKKAYETILNHINQLGRGQYILMQSRRKWKKRYYKAKGKLKNSIAKQAIRDKIEELNNTKGDLADTIVANAKVEVLIELLGE